MTDEIHTHLSGLIIQACRAHRNYAESAMNALGLHTGQEMILFQLWREEGLTPSQFASTLCVEPPTVTKMLQRLEAAGFVERKQDSDDARVSRVYLTPAGRALEQPVCEVWTRLEAQTTQGISEVEQALLARLLRQMAENLAK